MDTIEAARSAAREMFYFDHGNHQFAKECGGVAIVQRISDGSYHLLMALREDAGPGLTEGFVEPSRFVEYVDYEAA